MDKIHLLKFNICVLLVVLTLAQGDEKLGQSENESPLSPTHLVDEEDNNAGEICDPNKRNPCESPTAECMWSPLDMLYKCSHRGRGNKRNFWRKRHTKRKKPVNRHVKSDEKDAEQLEEERNAPLRELELALSGRSLVSNVNQNSGRVATVSGSKSRAAAEREEREKKAKEAVAGTREVPKYSGTMTWDGKTDNSEACTTKLDMAAALQESKSMESKLDWAESHKDTICDFTKFFHCAIDQQDISAEDSDEDDSEPQIPEDNIPVCRCYESSMAVVRGVCYIPADFGAKSTCGDTVTLPYPIQPWKGAPLLKPKCTPNSDCKESQYWFGTRCTCRYNAKWNSVTHTCDNGSKTTISVVVLSAMFFIHLVSSHFIV